MTPGQARALRLIAAVSAGALLAAAFPPRGKPSLAWIGLTPLYLAAHAATGWREALRLGLAAGAVMTAFGVSWMLDLLGTFGELPLWACVPLFAIYCLWTAIPFAAWAILLSSWTCPRVLAPLAAAAAFTGLWWSWPAIFPFTVLLGLPRSPSAIQAAELGGVALVELLVFTTSGLIAEAWRAPDRRRQRLYLVAALAIPIASTLVGRWRMNQLDAETTRTVRVGLVQPNIPLLWFDKQAKLARLREPSAAAQAEGADIIVWPENMYPWTLNRPFDRDFSDDDRILARHARPTLFGAGNAADSDLYGYNSAFHMSADGQVLGRFDKNLLVPLGEEIPLVDPAWAQGLVPGMAHNLRGDGPARFLVTPGPPGSKASPVSLGPLICYEDVFAWFARAVAAQPGGVEAFVNLTNDTWFGPTSEPSGHLALAQYRVVEHRIPMIRAVNSGPSSLIDRSGRVVVSTRLHAVSVDAPVPPEHLIADLELGRDTASAPTIYARGGWLFVHVCQVISAALLVLTAARPRRRA